MNKFRELAPIELWSARITTSLEKEEFTNTLAEVSEREQFTFFGYFVLNGLASQFTEYHFTRYPRRKYGISSIDQCNKVLTKLFHLVATKDHQAEACLEELTNQARVILGLLEGYDQKNTRHSIAEVQTILDTTRFEIKPAEIYTKGPDRFYSEAAAVILTNPQNIHAIYQLAARFKQERFTVENFPQHVSYVVETKYTQTPDEK